MSSLASKLDCSRSLPMCTDKSENCFWDRYFGTVLQCLHKKVQSRREVLLKGYDNFTRLAKVRSSQNFENTSIMPRCIGMRYGSTQRYNSPNGVFNTQA